MKKLILFSSLSYLAWNSTVSVNLADEVASTAATASPASSETSLVGTWREEREVEWKEEEEEERKKEEVEVSERGKERGGRGEKKN